ncbi:unnamed protein product [Zymoseptoria tritici ST99CH_3D7]|uniref:MYND-type domain-containing protein n=1 Tax=Zymoseptoria tritici (strain ST99CH_3D7) TaxID=1276538 RepID=A0A1X7S0T8_ZYMT9|nr:unnamed protein product [Zymoseptoria tritici ST99CH_3D7]
MTNIDAAERARLKGLGNLAVNRCERHVATIIKLAGRSKIDPFTAKDLANAAQKLMIVGEILGEDGKEFTETRERVIRDVIVTPSHIDAVQVWKNSASEKAKQYSMRPRPTADVLWSNMALTSGVTGATKASVDEFVAWLIEELFAIPLAAEEEEKKQNCAFCGTKSSTERVLMACSRCTVACYCDRTCQKMHWKKEHKANCVEKVKERQEAGDVVA